MKRIFGAAFLCTAIAFAFPVWAAPAAPEVEEFFRMVRSGDVAGVKNALADGQDVNVRDNSGNTPLHFGVLLNPNKGRAFDEGKLRVVDMLLDAGSDVNAKDKDKDGSTPLMFAGYLSGLSSDDLAERLVGTLLKAGADVNAKMSDDGFTALTVPSAFGSSEIVSALLKAGAKPENPSDWPGLLHLASGLIAAGRENMTGSFDQRAKQAVGAFLIGGQEFQPDFLGVTKLLVEAGADVNEKIKSTDKFFSFFNTQQADNNVYRQFENKTPLECARILGNTEVVKYLENNARRHETSGYR